MRWRALAAVLALTAILEVAGAGSRLEAALSCPPESCCGMSTDGDAAGCGGAGACCRVEAPEPRPPIVRADRAPLLAALAMGSGTALDVEPHLDVDDGPRRLSEPVARSAPLHLLHVRLNV